MQSNLMAFALFTILIASIGATPAFAQITEPIAVTTDKSSYSEGDTIIVSGEVKEILSGFPVSLQVVAANGNLVTIEQLDVTPDRTFSTELTAGGELWKSKGMYSIIVVYGAETRSAETTFEFGGSTTTTSKPGTPSGTSIEVEGNLVGYSISGGSILNISPLVEDNSLLIEISTTSDGEITITLPRTLIDATIGDEDDEFFVLVDGEEVDFDETKTDIDRTLTIQFFDGSEEIEIIGTFVVPEFGTIAALILAVAVISIIAVSAKTRLNIMPKI